MKKLLIFLFSSLAILTLVTNYFSLENAGGEPSYELGKSVQKSPWLLYRMNRTKRNYVYPWPNCTRHLENELWIRRVRLTYTVLSNIIPGSRKISCEDELITLTTQGDYRYLDNLIPLVERWWSPVSIALYVPYDDLDPTLRRIWFIRECTTPLVKEWISFHLYSETRHFPHAGDEVLKLWAKLEAIERDELCSAVPAFDVTEKSSRNLHNLTYPVNVGRNIARLEVTTHFILVSDIELFPSVTFVPEFFKMLRRRRYYFQNRANPYVFVLPIFEVQKDHDLPDTKDQLIDLVTHGLSVTFHKHTCTHCHEIPNYEAWLVADTPNGDEMNVFDVAKRNRTYKRWEPLYVSTNNVPLYDEGISWEDRGDKMAQSYALCILDYDFMILDNAFLVHKPGIKMASNGTQSDKQLRKMRKLIIRTSEYRMRKRYGERGGC